MSHSILLIDDAEDVHSIVRGLLEGHPVRVNSVYDGETGICAASRLQPDLILLDVDMPGTDGLEVCRRLSGDPITSSIPIIFLTAHGEPNQKVEGLDLGALDYIVKPFEPSEFTARIRGALRVKSRLDSIRCARVDNFINRSLAGALNA